MNKLLAPSIILTGALLSGGCATKKFVLNTTSPIQTKVDQVGDQTNKNTASIEDTRKEIKGVDEKSEAGISAAKERAMTAESRANDAMGKATEAGTAAASARTVADNNSRELASLRGVVSNLDDYKLAKEASVNFGFGKSALTDDAKAELDSLVANKGTMKRFVISVEGFTDKTGSAEYNLALSRQRANAVVNYLVSKHDIPVYRIYTIGLGEDKLVDEGHDREARAKNRRVEVKIFSADSEAAVASR
jgi:OmpA-OmpF porin, OOP family